MEEFVTCHPNIRPVRRRGDPLPSVLVQNILPSNHIAGTNHIYCVERSKISVISTGDRGSNGLSRLDQLRVSRYGTIESCEKASQCKILELKKSGEKNRD